MKTMNDLLKQFVPDINPRKFINNPVGLPQAGIDVQSIVAMYEHEGPVRNRIAESNAEVIDSRVNVFLETGEGREFHAELTKHPNTVPEIIVYN